MVCDGSSSISESIVSTARPCSTALIGVWRMYARHFSEYGYCADSAAVECPFLFEWYPGCAVALSASVI